MRSANTAFPIRRKWHEVRCHPRFQCDVRFTLVCFRGEKRKFWGRAPDICEQGLAATIVGELDINEVVSVELRLPLAQGIVTLRVAVRHRNGFFLRIRVPHPERHSTADDKKNLRRIGSDGTRVAEEASARPSVRNRPKRDRSKKALDPLPVSNAGEGAGATCGQWSKTIPLRHNLMATPRELESATRRRRQYQ